MVGRCSCSPGPWLSPAHAPPRRPWAALVGIWGEGRCCTWAPGYGSVYRACQGSVWCPSGAHPRPVWGCRGPGLGPVWRAVWGPVVGLKSVHPTQTLINLQPWRGLAGPEILGRVLSTDQNFYTAGPLDLKPAPSDSLFQGLFRNLLPFSTPNLEVSPAVKQMPGWSK